ncbi:MAG: HAMP domain-containing sensor histidine kinase [Gemmatimonadota bacterium]
MRRHVLGRWAPAIVSALILLLAGLTISSSVIVVRHFRNEARSITRLSYGVYAALSDPREGAEADALVEIGKRVRQLGIPVIITDTAGRVTAADNLPFDAPVDDPRTAAYVRTLDRENPPLVESTLGTVVHYGSVPAEQQLTVLAVLQGLTLIVVVAVGIFAYRSAMAAQRDRLWAGMAREAAHQLGTPLTSLKGWVEQIRSRPTPPTGLADYLASDADRLDRVARRFERIGHPARREPVGLGVLAGKVAEYFRPRLPRVAGPIELRVMAPGPGPMVLGDPVLLEWALENLVKNAIDALQGRTGSITLEAHARNGAAELRVVDDGPGVSRDVRRTLFDPGITTKTGGWGIGLALSRRVIEDSHGGELVLENTEHGASFLIRMPLHEARQTTSK